MLQDVPVVVLRHELSVDYQEPNLPQPEVCGCLPVWVPLLKCVLLPETCMRCCTPIPQANTRTGAGRPSMG